MTENTVAVIPARGGSKGIRDKNLQKVGGKTLVQLAIEHAQKATGIDRVIVSSDSSTILIHARECGAETLQRPTHLATDDAPGDEVLIHAVQSMGRAVPLSPEHLTVFLQPTSPFRMPEVIDECIEAVASGRFDSVFTGVKGHFVWKYVEAPKDSGLLAQLVPAVGSIEARKMRQRMTIWETPVVENGAIYVSRTQLLIDQRNRLCGRIGTVEMTPEDSIDIDTPYDLWLANQRADFLASQQETRTGWVVGERGLVQLEEAST